MPVHDAHARAFRSSAKFRYVKNPNNKFRSTLFNWTMHCHIKPHPASRVRVSYAMNHIHTHHMFEPKRPGKETLDRWVKHESREFMPEVYQEAWKLQQLSRL